MDAKTWLKQYPALYSETNVLCQRLDRLEQSSAPVAARELLTVKKRCTENLDRLEAMQDVVYKLDDPFEQEVILLRYFDGPTGRLMPWKAIATRLYGSDESKNLQRVFRIHKSALQRLAYLLDRQCHNVRTL